MKKIKKLLALIMAMAMVLGMSVTAMAASHGSVNDTQVASVTGNIASADDVGKITVTGITSGKVTAYKIVSASYDGGYFKGYISNVDGMTLGKDENGCLTISKTPAELTAQIKDETITGLESHNVNVDSSGTTEIGNLPIGVYIIVVSEVSDGRVYNPMMGSVYYDPESMNGTEIKATTINVKYVEGGTVDKTIATVDKVFVNGKETTKIGLGSTIGFEIKGTVPSYDMNMYKNPVYTLTDTLSKGLEYVPGTLAIAPNSVIRTDEEVVTKNENGTTTIIITLSSDEITTLAGQEIKVTYSAKVTEDAQVESDMPNTVKLEYSTTPKETGSKEDITHQYTFEINGDLTKVDESGNKLSGAVFTLYTDEACTTAYTRPGSDDPLTATTGADGDIEFTKIPEGTYYVKETTAPSGYQITGKIFKVEIVASSDKEDAQVTITDLTNNAVTNEVINTKLSSLPSTGGIGTTIFTIGGCVIMIIAAGLFFASRRKSAK